MNIINTKLFRFKSGSKTQYGLINRLWNLLINLSKEALRDINIDRNQRAKRLLTVLSKEGLIQQVLNHNQ